MGTFYKELGEKRPYGNFGPARGLLRKLWLCSELVIFENGWVLNCSTHNFCKMFFFCKEKTSKTTSNTQIFHKQCSTSQGADSSKRRICGFMKLLMCRFDICGRASTVFAINVSVVKKCSRARVQALNSKDKTSYVVKKYGYVHLKTLLNIWALTL